MLAKMAYEIVLAPQAVADLSRLPANRRAAVSDAIERHLRHEPTKASRTRIKRLRGFTRPQYRLRVEEIRVFYDVTETAVEILAIVSKSAVDKWLEREGESDEGGGAIGSKG
jgi:mRNA-degrading endonuclease RelE of RelBE toxin-antitoxin system